MKFREAVKIVTRHASKARQKQIANMSPEARSEMMRKVARARWDKAAASAGATPQAAPAAQPAQN